VDVSGETVAEKISADLVGLEKSMSQLVVSSVHLDARGRATHDRPKTKDLAPPKTSSTAISQEQTLDALRDVMHDELGEHTMPQHDTSAGVHGSFGELQADLQAQHEKRAVQRASLIRDIGHRMDKLGANLADVVSDRKAWKATVQWKQSQWNPSGNNHTEAGIPSKELFMPKRLQWSAIPTFQHHKVKRSEFLESTHKHPVVVYKSDVKHMHWTGDFPKVAAVAWIRGNRKTRSRMMYFVDNFKLQDYKGPRELVLVYHYKDAVAAEIVHRYVNDTDVKAVAAHDFSQESFPSDPALRYAAWGSDANIVAQWDFDEWHDPSRLSLQVRAMALAHRHACVLSTRSASHSQEDEDQEIRVVSVIGEKAWMTEHWHPITKLNVEVSEAFHAGDVVELDMQNKALMDNISRIEHVFVATTPKPAEVDATVVAKDEGGTEFSRSITECLDYDTSTAHSEEDLATEKSISENVGPDFGKKFHDLLHKRHDVTLKLQLLCFQTGTERDKDKKKFMHDHVLEMDKIRLDLDQHIKNTAAMFGGANWIGHLD
jgi:hypothetical protein